MKQAKKRILEEKDEDDLVLAPHIREEEFLLNYDLRDFPPCAHTADIVILTVKKEKLSVLLIQRSGHPYRNCWAIPGGFKNQNESLDDCALRELKEETNIMDLPQGFHLEQIKTYSAPGRDPRGDIISTAFVALIPFGTIPKTRPGSDARRVRYWAVDDLLAEKGPTLAFDHRQIIKDALERVRNRLEYINGAASFL